MRAISIQVSVERANASVMHGKLDLHFLHFIPLGNKMAILEEVSKEGRESSESGGKFLGGFQVWPSFPYLPWIPRSIFRFINRRCNGPWGHNSWRPAGGGGVGVGPSPVSCPATEAWKEEPDSSGPNCVLVRVFMYISCLPGSWRLYLSLWRGLELQQSEQGPELWAYVRPVFCAYTAHWVCSIFTWQHISTNCVDLRIR